ncbi:hypothetical protein EYF80_013974 [Liparis tanakae]|uniref:Secreted protein n=1 Tax=Liparis tanakae TaxID=230148 RepID=A0A4Z2ID55_9TELE|nr:hypothetical protein EYF80_013974 [Liparis tanakae]
MFLLEATYVLILKVLLLANVMLKQSACISLALSAGESNRHKESQREWTSAPGIIRTTHNEHREGCGLNEGSGPQLQW